MSKKRNNFKKTFKKIWYFIWEDDSILSWIINIILAFILIKFIVFPGLSLLLGTSHPVVAVVSGSMEHKTVPECIQTATISGNEFCVKRGDKYQLCNSIFDEKQKSTYDLFWSTCGYLYEELDIEKSQFSKFSFKNGFNTGDIIVLNGKKPKDLKIGDVIVFQATKPDPIIHRIIQKKETGGVYFFTTKGDHNPGIIPFEENIPQDRIIGKALFRIPYLGYIKIWFVEILRYIGVLK